MARYPARYLVLMKGFPATGKSTLARGLSRKLGWPLIDKDDVKDHTLRLENGNELAYEIMWSICERQLSQGLSVIIDSPLTYPVAFDTGVALSKQYRARLLVVETVLNEREWRRRLDARNPAYSQHKIASWEDMTDLLVRYDGCWNYEIAPESHLVIDDSVRRKGALEAVLARIQPTRQRIVSRSSKHKQGA